MTTGILLFLFLFVFRFLLLSVVFEEIQDTRRLSASDAGMSTVYSTAQLPTIPSAQDIHSTAQLHTTLSPEKSAEGLIYATVIFHSTNYF